MVLEAVGEGGMGAVFAAYDTALDRKVALKVLHDALLGRANQEHLRREARAMAKLAHPNVVPVFDVGEHAGRSFYTMEFVRGESVRGWLRGSRGWREVQRVFLDAARGLAAIHAAGLVHRDVKPGNILLGEDGRARIADMGIALPDASTPDGEAVVATTTLRAAGTPAYMAPEQLGGAVGDARSDQFALGVSLYEALHARAPFDGDTVASRTRAIAAGPRPAVKDVPPWLDAVIRRALAVDPAARFPDVEAFARALAGPRPRRWPYVVAGGAALAAAAVIAIVVATRGGADPGACRDSYRRLTGVWDPAAATQLAVDFGRVGVPYAPESARMAARTLDRYAADWIAASDEACRVRLAGQDADTSARQRVCLEQRRAGLVQLTLRFAAPDAALVEAAADAADRLAPIADCADPGYLAGLTAVADPARDRIRADLAQVMLDHLLGKPDTRGLATAAVEAARALGDRALEAEALLAVGRSQVRTEATGAALTSFAAALEAATAAGDTRLRVDIWINLATALTELGQLDDAAATLDQIDAALRVAPDPLREARALQLRGGLLGRRGAYEQARAMFERSITLFVTFAGGDSYQQTGSMRNLTIALRRLGRNDEALATARRALELDLVLGAGHPLIARDRQAIAVVLSSIGRYAEALDELVQANAIMRAARGDDHTDVANIEADLAVVLSKLSRPDEAIAHQRLAVAILELREPGRSAAVSARAQLANLLARAGQAAEAEPILRALLEARVRLGEPPAVLGLAHRQLADALRSLDRHDDALAEYGAARTLYADALGPAARELAELDAARAAVERDRGDHRAARELDLAAKRIFDLPPHADHPARFAQLIGLAEDELALRAPRRALALAETALAYFEHVGPPQITAHIQWILARALQQTGGDLAIAVAHARAAEEVLAAAHDAATLDIHAWLAKHDR